MRVKQRFEKSKENRRKTKFIDRPSILLSDDNVLVMNVIVTLTLCNHNILVQISIAFTVVVSHILAPSPPLLGA